MPGQQIIDFIRHAEPTQCTDINPRNAWLSPRGIQQANWFGAQRVQHGERYDAIITSGVPRTYETAEHILAAGCAVQYVLRMVVPMFDGLVPDEHTRARQAAYAKLKAAPLRAYRAQCHQALESLGHDAFLHLQNAFQAARQLNRARQSRHTLIVGHAVYINQIILSLYLGDLPVDWQTRLLDDPPLGHCAGYRLVFGFGQLSSVMDLPASPVA